MKVGNPKKFNEALRKTVLSLMDGDGFTQEQRARRAGITQATMSRIMAGKQTISVFHLVRLANLFKVRLDDLVGRKVQEP